MSTTANNEQEPKATYSKEIELGDLVSIPFGSKFLQGIVKEISPEKLTIDSKANGEVSIPNTKNVYKFFPGQKFDFREFYSKDPNNKNNLSIIEKLDNLLAKTSVESFTVFQQQNKAEVVQLLTGKLTNKLIHGSSLVSLRDSQNNPIEGTKTMIEWAAKVQIIRGNDGHLKVENVFKNQKELDLKVYNIEITPEQKVNMVEKNQSVTLTRFKKDNTEFKIFAKYDKDLNKIVTSPYSEKVEVRMKESYSKKENEVQKNTAGEKVIKPKNDQAQKPETKKTEQKKQRKL